MCGINYPAQIATQDCFNAYKNRIKSSLKMPSSSWKNRKLTKLTTGYELIQNTFEFISNFHSTPYGSEQQLLNMESCTFSNLLRDSTSCKGVKVLLKECNKDTTRHLQTYGVGKSSNVCNEMDLILCHAGKQILRERCFYFSLHRKRTITLLIYQ